MPDTDGVTLLKEWSAAGLLSMPVVMMSGHATIDTAVDATRIGAFAFLEKTFGESAPERLQLVEALPRRADGSVRAEVLQLIAMNQLDQVDAILGDETERRIVAKIIADRRNLRDRFTF